MISFCVNKITMTGKGKPTKKNPPIRSSNRLKENKSNVARKKLPVKKPKVAKVAKARAEYTKSGGNNEGRKRPVKNPPVAKVAKARAVSTQSGENNEGRKRVKKKRRSITDTLVGNRDHIIQTPIYRYLHSDNTGIGACFECQKCGPLGKMCLPCCEGEGMRLGACFACNHQGPIWEYCEWCLHARHLPTEYGTCDACEYNGPVGKVCEVCNDGFYQESDSYSIPSELYDSN